MDVEHHTHFATSEFALRGREVSCFALQYVFLELERRGDPIEPIIRDLPYPLEHLRDPGQRVDWKTLCVVAERVADLFDEQEMIELGERANTSPLVRWMTVVARVLFTPNEYYRFALREFCRKFACIEASLQTQQPGWLRCHLYMREGYEPCPPLFDALRGAFSMMPRLLGLGRATVTCELTPSGAVIDVHLSPGGFRLTWIRRLVTWPFAARWAAQELQSAHAILHERYVELARKDAALLESERSLRALMEQATDAIVISDPSGLVLDVNARVCEWLGRPREQLLRLRALDLLGRKEIEGSLALWGKSDTPLESVVSHAEGRPLPVEISSTRLDDGRLLWIMRDISIRKRIEEDRKRYQEDLELQLELQAADLRRTHAESQELHRRLMHAQHLRATEDLAEKLATSIYNPLSALIGTLQMALEEKSRDPHAMRQALHLAERINRTVGDILRFFQGGALDVKLESPHALLHDVREDLLQRAADRGVEIGIDADASLPALEVDRALITAALVAIAENGIDAMPSGGSLTLRAALLPMLPVIEIEVIDQGGGIPASIRPRIYEPYFTTKGGGTGLGLSIAEGIIHGHGGRIQTSDRPGGGTIVSVELRADVPPANGIAPELDPLPRRVRVKH